MLWSAHHCMCMACLVFVLCQPVHSCIESFLHGLDFFLEIFLWRLVPVFIIFLRGTAHVIAVDASSMHVSALIDTSEWRPTCSQYTLCPLSPPRKKKSLEWGCMQLCSKRSSKGPSSKIIYGYWWLFKCNTYRVTVLGCFKQKIKNNSDFWPFFNLEQVLDTISVTVYWGQPIISSSKCLWTLAFAAWWNYCHINANTLLEPPSCFWVIPMG